MPNAGITHEFGNPVQAINLDGIPPDDELCRNYSRYQEQRKLISKGSFQTVAVFSGIEFPH